MGNEFFLARRKQPFRAPCSYGLEEQTCLIGLHSVKFNLYVYTVPLY